MNPRSHFFNTNEWMKHIVPFLLILCFVLMSIPHCSPPVDKHKKARLEEFIVIKGSENLRYVFDSLVLAFDSKRSFEAENETLPFPFKVVGGGTERGIGALIDGNHSGDIIISNRALSFDDRSLMQEYHPDKNIDDLFQSYPYAVDELRFHVHVDNPISSIHRRNLVNIYNGKIRFWSEIYPNIPLKDKQNQITPLGRETNTGSYSMVSQVVFNHQLIHEKVLVMKNDIEVIDFLSKNIDAIGYISRASAKHYQTNFNESILPKIKPVRVIGLYMNGVDERDLEWENPDQSIPVLPNNPTEEASEPSKNSGEKAHKASTSKDIKNPPKKPKKDAKKEKKSESSKNDPSETAPLASENMMEEDLSTPAELAFPENIDSVDEQVYFEQIQKREFRDEDLDEGFYEFSKNPLIHTCYIFIPNYIKPENDLEVDIQKEKHQIIEQFILFIFSEDGLAITKEYGLIPISKSLE